MRVHQRVVSYLREAFWLSAKVETLETSGDPCLVLEVEAKIAELRVERERGIRGECERCD